MWKKNLLILVGLKGLKMAGLMEAQRSARNENSKLTILWLLNLMIIMILEFHFQLSADLKQIKKIFSRCLKLFAYKILIVLFGFKGHAIEGACNTQSKTHPKSLQSTKLKNSAGNVKLLQLNFYTNKRFTAISET